MSTGKTSHLVAGAPDLLEYLPGKPRMGAPDNISAIIRSLEERNARLEELLKEHHELQVQRECDGFGAYSLTELYAKTDWELNP